MWLNELLQVIQEDLIIITEGIYYLPILQETKTIWITVSQTKQHRIQYYLKITIF